MLCMIISELIFILFLLQIMIHFNAILGVQERATGMENAGLIAGQAACCVSAPTADLEHQVLHLVLDQLDYLAHPLQGAVLDQLDQGARRVGEEEELQQKKHWSSWLSLRKWTMCMKNLRSWARGD